MSTPKFIHVLLDKKAKRDTGIDLNAYGKGLQDMLNYFDFEYISEPEINWTLMLDSNLIDLAVATKQFRTQISYLPSLTLIRSIVHRINKQACDELKKRGIRYE